MAEIHPKPEPTRQREILSPPITESEIVLQEAFSIAGVGTNKRYIQTEGAGPCFIIVLHDSQRNVVSLAHSMGKFALQPMITKMEETVGGLPLKLKMRIIGGTSDNDNEKALIVERLQHFRNESVQYDIPIIEEDVNMASSEREEASIVVDAQTGILYNLGYGQDFTLAQRTRMDELTDELYLKAKREGEIGFTQNILDDLPSE